MLMMEPGRDDDGDDDDVALGQAAQAGRPACLGAAPGGLATQLVARFIITIIIRDGQAPTSACLSLCLLGRHAPSSLERPPSSRAEGLESLESLPARLASLPSRPPTPGPPIATSHSSPPGLAVYSSTPTRTHTRKRFPKARIRPEARLLRPSLAARAWPAEHIITGPVRVIGQGSAPRDHLREASLRALLLNTRIGLVRRYDATATATPGPCTSPARLGALTPAQTRRRPPVRPRFTFFSSRSFLARATEPIEPRMATTPPALPPLPVAARRPHCSYGPSLSPLESG